MDQQQFDALRAAGYNHIPVVREILADLDTPLSVYLKLADGANTFLLESVEGGETWGRYSIIGLPATRTVTYADGALSIRHADGLERIATDDPLSAIESLRSRYRVPEIDGLPHSVRQVSHPAPKSEC